MNVISTRIELGDTLNKVQLYLGVHRYDAAEKLIKATLADHGPLAHMHNLLGLTYHKQSRFYEALTEFYRAIEINPGYVEAALNLVATLCDLSRYDEAREVFSHVQTQTDQQRRQPDLILGRLANQHAANGRLYRQSNMPADAIREFRKALSLFARMPDVKLELGKLYVQVGQHEKGQQEFEEIIGMAPGIVEARTWLGILYFKLGKIEMARDQWMKAQQTDPNDLISRAYLRISTQPQSRPPAESPSTARH